MIAWHIPLLVTALHIASAQSAATPGASPAVASGILNGYINGSILWTTRGLWYNTVEWAARTSNCATNSTSVACLACSMDLPAAAVANRVAPIAVANALWFQSERGAICGTCFKVYMLNGTTTVSAGCPNPSDPNSGVSCAGQGLQPYISSVSDPQNYGAKVLYDASKNLPYFIGMAVEWLDRNQTDDYTIAYSTQKTANVDKFGSWPVQYQGVPCPGADQFPMEFQFLDYTRPVTTYTTMDSTAWLTSGVSVGLNASVLADGPLCNNLAGQPCGTTTSYTTPLLSIKLQITGNRIPIGAVDIYLQDQQWHQLSRSGDGYWESKSGLDFTANASVPVNVRVTCVDGTQKIEYGLLPSKMLCAYQDPLCRRFTGTIQC